ncbi:MAG: rubrerythrin family protein [Bacteroidetes bacterium]|nr:rubrerythrin family protein [Bacteroidota bacterium]
MPTLKGTKTEQNLLKSFAGESQATNRYLMFAKIAKKEGYQQIAKVFKITAKQEIQHAKRFFRFLEGGNVEITASYPAGKESTTPENLKASAMGEHEEWSELYPEFAKIANAEGFSEIAEAFQKIAIAEKGHQERFEKLLANLEKGEVFKKTTPVRWYCRNCGMIVEGTNAPDMCPACLHSQAYFQVNIENY